MTKDEIIAMSKQFWLTDVGAETLSRGWDVEITIEDLEKIIHLVEKQEREQCAKVCDEQKGPHKSYGSKIVKKCAEAIRSRK